MSATISPSTDIDLTSRCVHLFLEAWRWQRASQAKSYKPVVCQGISVYLTLEASESRFRSSISCGETEYDTLADLKYFGLMWVWLQVSEEILSAVEGLNEQGFKIAEANEPKRIVVESRRLFQPNLSGSKRNGTNSATGAIDGSTIRITTTPYSMLQPQPNYFGSSNTKTLKIAVWTPRSAKNSRTTTHTRERYRRAPGTCGDPRFARHLRSSELATIASMKRR